MEILSHLQPTRVAFFLSYSSLKGQGEKHSLECCTPSCDRTSNRVDVPSVKAPIENENSHSATIFSRIIDMMFFLQPKLRTGNGAIWKAVHTTNRLIDL
mmetsp:Transcript_10381/g.24729  ORF Transcript_10381/g.24729 Transcript_10381/m.24729 type:complete len:99 (+) Transcript_10381:1742-2038(+)